MNKLTIKSNVGLSEAKGREHIQQNSREGIIVELVIITILSLKRKERLQNTGLSEIQLQHRE